MASTVQARSGSTDITEIGQEMWSYLTGKDAAVEYAFEDLSVEVPKTTEPDAQRAVWKLSGTLRITTTDEDSPGSTGGL